MSLLTSDAKPLDRVEMTPSGSSDRKAYLPSSSMESLQLAMPAQDGQASMRTMPQLPPFSQQRADPYGMSLFQPPVPPPPPHHHHSMHPHHGQHPQQHQQQHQQHHPVPSNTDPSRRLGKRRASLSDDKTGLPPPMPGESSGGYFDTRYAGPSQGDMSQSPQRSKKKTRTNTPWTATEEQRLRTMRDAGHSWNSIALTFPARTEGSVKKHFYKDMHHADFDGDEVPHTFVRSLAAGSEPFQLTDNQSHRLLAAIKEYDSNKWKVIGQKVGKPAKACEQYARDHFSMSTKKEN